MLTCACGSSSAAVSPTPAPSSQMAGTVKQTKEDCFYSPAIEHLREGEITFAFENQTGQQAGFDVWPIKNGKTFSDFVTFVSGERTLALAGKDLHDPQAVFGYGPSIHDSPRPDASRSLSSHLSSGDYAVACIRFFEELGTFGPSAVAGPVTVEAA